MEYKYNVEVNGVKKEMKLIINDLLYNKIVSNTNDVDGFIIDKIYKYHWDFNTIDTHNKIINDIETDIKRY